MNTLIKTTVVAFALVAGVAGAQAGHGLEDAAAAGSIVTTHGILGR